MALLAQCGQAGWLNCRQGWCRPGQNWAELSKQRLLLQGSGGGGGGGSNSLQTLPYQSYGPGLLASSFSCYRRRRSFSLPPSMVRLLFSSAQAIRRRRRRAAQACKQKLHRA